MKGKEMFVILEKWSALHLTHSSDSAWQRGFWRDQSQNCVEETNTKLFSNAFKNDWFLEDSIYAKYKSPSLLFLWLCIASYYLYSRHKYLNYSIIHILCLKHKCHCQKKKINKKAQLLQCLKTLVIFYLPLSIYM